MAIQVKPPDLRTIEVPIVSISALIVHKWSKKAKEMMLAKQQKKIVQRQPKDPQQDYEESMYRFPDGRHGFPATGFKAALVQSCRMIDGIHMTQAKVAIYIYGDSSTESQLVEIFGKPEMREDMVRLEKGVADIRYRAAYYPWTALLKVRYNAHMLSDEMVVNMVEYAGQSGIGEWRPSAPKVASGQFGMFQVDLSKQIKATS